MRKALRPGEHSRVNDYIRARCGGKLRAGPVEKRILNSHLNAVHENEHHHRTIESRMPYDPNAHEPHRVVRVKAEERAVELVSIVRAFGHDDVEQIFGCCPADAPAGLRGWPLAGCLKQVSRRLILWPSGCAAPRAWITLRSGFNLAVACHRGAPTRRCQRCLQVDGKQIPGTAPAAAHAPLAPAAPPSAANGAAQSARGSFLLGRRNGRPHRRAAGADTGPAAAQAEPASPRRALGSVSFAEETCCRAAARKDDAQPCGSPARADSADRGLVTALCRAGDCSARIVRRSHACRDHACQR